MKKHEILSKTEQALNGLEQTTKARVGGQTFVLRLLTRTEETRARSLVESDNLVTVFTDSNVPQLAYALDSIDGVDAAELFVPETAEEKSAAEDDKRKWRAKAIMAWLGSLPTNVVEQLWMKYLDLKQAVSKGLEELEDFS